MDLGLTPEQIESRKRFSDFVDEYIAPVADQNDRDEETPIELIKSSVNKDFLALSYRKNMAVEVWIWLRPDFYVKR